VIGRGAVAKKDVEFSRSFHGPVVEPAVDLGTENIGLNFLRRNLFGVKGSVNDVVGPCSVINLSVGFGRDGAVEGEAFKRALAVGCQNASDCYEGKLVGGDVEFSQFLCEVDVNGSVELFLFGGEGEESVGIGHVDFEGVERLAGAGEVFRRKGSVHFKGALGAAVGEVDVDVWLVGECGAVDPHLQPRADECADGIRVRAG